MPDEAEAYADKIVALAHDKRKHKEPDQKQGATDWPEPKPLPCGLAPVDPFNSEFLPDALAPWVDDIANRLQCPPDYVAVAALTSLGAVIGRRIGIKPQAKTDWIEIPNIWGCFIGRPGMLKSPAMMEALKPIHHLEAEAAKQNEVDQQAYSLGLDAYKLKKEVARALLKEKLKSEKNPNAEINVDVGDEPKEPTALRYRTNDTSYEKLGELLMANPTGILIERDELVSLLKHLDRDDQAGARGFYLSGASGTLPYTLLSVDIGTSTRSAFRYSATLSLPASAEYVRRANYGGAGGDGLIQRFGLLVWPDAPADWTNVDEYPNRAAREKAWAVWERMAKIDQTAALKLGG